MDITNVSTKTPFTPNSDSTTQSIAGALGVPAPKKEAPTSSKETIDAKVERVEQASASSSKKQASYQGYQRSPPKGSYLDTYY